MTIQDARTKMEGLLNVNPPDIHKAILPFSNNKEYFKFTYRRQLDGVDEKRIYPFPSSIEKMFSSAIAADRSFQAPLMPFEDLLDSLPTVQIREYVFDPRLAQVVNIISKLMEGFQDAFGSDTKPDTTLSQQVTNLMKEFPENVIGAMVRAIGGVGLDSFIDYKGNNKQLSDYVVKLPFVLQYLMFTAKTKNFYFLPYSGKVVDSSNGMDGWDSQGINGLGLKGDNAHSIFGALAKYVGKNVGIRTTPTWGGDGGTNLFPELTVEVDLFNDTAEAAANNFLFINTIVPMNKFLQYHIMQLNPAVYDIKVEGYSRLFLCKARMDCTYKGVSRVPSKDVLKAISVYVNEDFGLMDKLKDKKNPMDENYLISIPDVYSLRITFQSMMPNSLNNYMYQYCANMDIEKSTKEEWDNLYLGARDVLSNMNNNMKDIEEGKAKTDEAKAAEGDAAKASQEAANEKAKAEAKADAANKKKAEEAKAKAEAEAKAKATADAKAAAAAKAKAAASHTGGTAAPTETQTSETTTQPSQDEGSTTPSSQDDGQSQGNLEERQEGDTLGAVDADAADVDTVEQQQQQEQDLANAVNEEETRMQIEAGQEADVEVANPEPPADTPQQSLPESSESQQNPEPPAEIVTEDQSNVVQTEQVKTPESQQAIAQAQAARDEDTAAENTPPSPNPENLIKDAEQQSSDYFKEQAEKANQRYVDAQRERILDDMGTKKEQMGTATVTIVDENGNAIGPKDGDLGSGWSTNMDEDGNLIMRRTTPLNDIQQFPINASIYDPGGDNVSN